MLTSEVRLNSWMESAKVQSTGSGSVCAPSFQAQQMLCFQFEEPGMGFPGLSCRLMVYGATRLAGLEVLHLPPQLLHLGGGSYFHIIAERNEGQYWNALFFISPLLMCGAMKTHSHLYRNIMFVQLANVCIHKNGNQLNLGFSGFWPENWKSNTAHRSASVLPTGTKVISASERQGGVLHQPTVSGNNLCSRQTLSLVSLHLPACSVNRALVSY